MIPTKQELAALRAEKHGPAFTLAHYATGGTCINIPFWTPGNWNPLTDPPPQASSFKVDATLQPCSACGRSGPTFGGMPICVPVDVRVPEGKR